MKHATKTLPISKLGMVYYNNVLSTLILLPVILINGELGAAVWTEGVLTVGFCAVNFAAGFIGFFLNFASLSCVAATGPTTYAIIGSLNKIPTAVLGWVIFRTTISKETWFFIGVAMLGGFLYSGAEVKQRQKREAMK